MITESSSEVPPSAPRGPLPLVGIGASAGGLEPLERFLRNVPVASGIAFIVVQHLDPTHSTMLAELLQRCTLMSVREATEGMRVEADHVYVIPPDRDLAVENGVLRLSTVATPRGFRLPIDFLFASLAAEAGQGAVGIVLSGMGSDGSIGLAAIRAAEFSADVEAMPAMIAARLAAREPLPPRTGPAPAPAQPLTATGPALSDDDVEPTLNADESQAFIRVLARLREQCGHDFSAYKRSTVLRRVERRMSIHHLGTVSAYAALVRDNGPELDLLFKEMLIGVTSFFRDPATWEALRAEVLPALLKARPPNVPIRAWVAGCSTGEEAYTLAILLREALAAADPPITTVPQIFATDLDLDAIVRARIGIYPASIADALTPARLAAHFTPCAGGFRVTRAIRESVVFAPHDVLLEPPFTKLDLLTCRNLLIYLSTELQQQVLATFHYSLRPGGFLLLGSAETVGPATTLFTSLDAKARLYRRLDSGETSRTLTYPVPIIRPPPVPSLTPVPPTDLQTAAEKLLRDRFAPAAVLANEKGDILYVSGRTGRFLEPAAGKANWNVFAMARDGLRHELVDAFRQATVRDDPVIRSGVVVGPPPTAVTITLTVQRLAEPPALEGLLIVVFTELATQTPAAVIARASGGGSTDDQRSALHKEIAELRLALAAAHEEKRGTLEERNAVHEELQSTNKELQSTNEELTTTKEETQSMNEELQTLNHELQTKVDDLSRVSDDMKNLLEHTEIAAVFLDGALCVRLFTAGSSRMFPLREADIGRPITDFSSAATYPGLADDAREVLRTLVVHERAFAAPDGRWFQVRMMPYRTLDNRVDGVAITFTDITVSKALEERLRATQVGLEQHITEQDQRISDAEARRST